MGLLALGPAAWVSHEAAAALHGFDRALPEPVELTVLRAARGRRMPFPLHTTASLPRIDQVTIGPFRAVSTTRTVIDLAHARVPRPRLEAAIDSAVRLGLSAPLVLHERLASSAALAAGALARSTRSSSTAAAIRCWSAGSSSSSGAPACPGRGPR